MCRHQSRKPCTSSTALAYLFSLFGCRPTTSFKPRVIANMPAASNSGWAGCRITPRRRPRTIWVHAVSVGEFLAASPLIAGSKRDAGPSGRGLNGDAHRPAARSVIEPVRGRFLFSVRLEVLGAPRCSIGSTLSVIILETELWPNFSRECRTRRITILANGRISPRSFRRYSVVRSFIKRVFETSR